MPLALSGARVLNLRKILVLLLALTAFAVAGASAGSGKKVDIDLARMSGTMVYAQVYQMVTHPEEYMGKHIKMKGIFSTYVDDMSGQRFYGCVIMDALACCSQGLAFELSKPRKYPEGYPAEGETITIEGDFDFVEEEDGAAYPMIRKAEMLK